MSEQQTAEKDYVAEGEFQQSARVRHSVWYHRRLIEITPHGASKKHGGQILMTPEQVVDLIAVLSQVVADAKEAERG